MDRSPYLQQAIQAMGQQPAAPQPAGPDLGAMRQQVDQRRAWEAANPGQSFSQHQLAQVMAGVKGAPQAVAGAPANLAASLGGLFKAGG